jgi:tetratricopeptide (TPR) repeat protein
MTVAVVFAFAVADGLSPVVGAAPYDVLARQLPRLLVARLNGGGDRGVRFFPFLGTVDGQRDFFVVREPFAPEALAQLHKQGDVELLFDAVLRPGQLHWRLLSGDATKVRAEGDLPFDARRPLDVLPRLEFEVVGALGWTGRPQAQGHHGGELLGWMLVLRDALLRREAGLVDPAADPLRPARRCLELATGDADVEHLVLEFAAHLLRRGEQKANLAALLAPAALRGDDAARLERLAGLLTAAGDAASAATALARAAARQPERADLVERAAVWLYQLGRDDELRAVVEAARVRGVASDTAIAQLAASHDRAGDRTARRALTEELLARPRLALPVARLVVSFLLEDDRPGEARAVAEHALTAAPDHAMLHFELGRALLQLGAEPAASVALQRAQALGLPPLLRPQAQRLVRMAAVPGLWAGTLAVENALGARDLRAALRAAKRLVRSSAGAAEAWFQLGLVRHKLGRERRAEQALRAALRRDETLADAHNRLGILLVGDGRVDEGHRHLERAHELAPHDSSPLLHLAQACALLERFAEAERHVVAAAEAGADPQLVDAVRRAVLKRPA